MLPSRPKITCANLLAAPVLFMCLFFSDCAVEPSERVNCLHSGKFQEDAETTMLLTCALYQKEFDANGADATTGPLRDCLATVRAFKRCENRSGRSGFKLYSI